MSDADITYQLIVDRLTDIACALDDIAIEHPATYRLLGEHLGKIKDAGFSLCELLLADRAEDSDKRVVWYLDPERCSVCGQPDNCGDCDHTPAEAVT